MPALTTEQIEEALAKVETEIVSARKRVTDAITAARTEGDKRLASLKEEKQLLQGLRRIAGSSTTTPAAPASRAARSTTKRSTTPRRTRAKQKNVGQPERREQIIKLVAQAPLGAGELAAQLKLSRTRIHQIADGMIKDGALRSERLGDGRNSRVVYAAPSALPATAAAKATAPTGGTAKTRQTRKRVPAAS